MTTSQPYLQEKASTKALREDIAKFQDHRKEEKTRFQNTITNLQDRHEELEGKISLVKRLSEVAHADQLYRKLAPSGWYEKIPAIYILLWSY